jgi:hypothetical protein
MTDVKRTLKVPLKVKEGGHSRRMSTQEGALMLLRESADKERQRLPVSGDAERPLPNARRGVPGRPEG